MDGGGGRWSVSIWMMTVSGIFFSPISCSTGTICSSGVREWSNAPGMSGVLELLPERLQVFTSSSPSSPIIITPMDKYLSVYTG